MAELMEHRRSIVPRDQQRFTGLALHEVSVVGNDRGDLAIDSFLGAVSVHPRARAFPGARVRIEIPETDMFLRRLICHYPDANVGMSNRNTCHRREVEIEELARDPEDALA